MDEAIRLIHATEPSPAFWLDFVRYANLDESLKIMFCSWVHFKSVIIDGLFTYSGSVNLTGVCLGAKFEDERNFESDFVLEQPALGRKIMDQFDVLRMGDTAGHAGGRSSAMSIRTWKVYELKE